ncbi:unnamed protein product [Acanthoscelides obtectus]|uniref:Uncharacterized protein n=1 Tax=Acanthoscelides obtectus TaxID=200917 RepID=A0A9P0K1T9_ACAOB|nr:unnamed protein product [Acanthoscelides obtectus]CAK1652981.1 SIN3-HDAC complex-associated factor [Acanthoscelides obtectus]
MFSFHRPKVYRSSTGCCICKAKSSSSRFTDSKKYEEDFLECFKLSQPRQGEICNACVLLVKRWKKLPAGSDRNWQHVVDARAGPGIKSMTKFKVKNRKLEEKKKKALESMETDQPFDREASPDSSSEGNEENEDFLGGHLGRVDSPGGSDGEEVRDCSRRSRYKAIARRRRQELEMVSDFVDLGYWKRETVCCGIIFKGLNNEIMVDPSYMKPCRFRQAASCKLQVLSGAKPSEPLATKAYSDSSSDSGYDDSSNQSALSDSATAILKKDSVVSNRMVCIAEMHRMASRVN